MKLDPIRPSIVNAHKSTDVDSHKPTRAVARLSVDVPFPLMRELKVHAAAKGTTIQRIVLQLLRAELQAPLAGPSHDTAGP